MEKILITGTSRGIGETLKKSFTKDGHTVFGITSKDFNLARVEQVDSAFLMHKDATVLINNAGVCNPLENVATIEKFYDIFNLNTFAPIQLAMLYSDYWIKNGIKGKIINVTSRVAIKGSVEAPHYAASKAALESFTHSWAMRMAAHGIGVYAIAPSWVETDILINNAKDLEVEKNKIPLNRFITKDELYPYFKFLVENDCSYMTGQVMDINGASYFR
jgi:NAD(P)-dependent dehydrogenase (short-subunit alcohol dehydrogenase family)